MSVRLGFLSAATAILLSGCANFENDYTVADAQIATQSES